MKGYGISTLESAKAPSKIGAFLFITNIFTILYYTIYTLYNVNWKLKRLR